MQERKLRVGFTGFPYGGNGGIRSEVPDLKNWLIPTINKIHADPRVEEILAEDFADTPITMTRNRAVEWALHNRVDVLVMYDSDMRPDMYAGKQPSAKEFFASSFDFLWEHFDKGPCIVVSPYCGPPPDPINGGEENVYVFHWRNYESGGPPGAMKLEAFSRHHAAMLTGISNIDAGPTGLMMADMRIFQHLTYPFFDYEWEGEGPQCPHCHQTTPGPRANKASTEDCFFFRNVALNGCLNLGYNPVFCNWDAWSGHWKPKCVGKPYVLTSDAAGRSLKEAVLKGMKGGSIKLRHFGKSQAELQKEAAEQNAKADKSFRVSAVERDLNGTQSLKDFAKDFGLNGGDK